MDLKNFSTSPLSMRISLQETGSTWYVSNPAAALPADNAWHTVTFPLTPAGMTATNGATPLSIGLTRIQEIRILDNPSADYRGAVISASFGVDNVRAVPEPGGALLLLGVLSPLLSRRSNRSRRTPRP
jgi:hypothetical protein